MLKKSVLISLCFVGFVSAQGTITGTVYAPKGGDVYGTVVIACAPTLDADECDEERTGFVQIGQGGESAPFEIRKLTAEHYLVLIWQDADGDGEITEGDPINYLMDGPDVALITPPAEGLELRFEASQANTPAPSSQSERDALLGSWSRGSISSVEFYNPTTGSWAPPSGSGSSYTFNSDGTFTAGVMAQSSLYSCTMTLFSHKEGSYHVNGEIITLNLNKNRFKSQDNCHEQYNYERDDPLESEYLLWHVGIDEDGTTYLELTDLILNAAGQLESKVDSGALHYTQE